MSNEQDQKENAIRQRRIKLMERSGKRMEKITGIAAEDHAKIESPIVFAHQDSISRQSSAPLEKANARQRSISSFAIPKWIDLLVCMLLSLLLSHLIHALVVFVVWHFIWRKNLVKSLKFVPVLLVVWTLKNVFRELEWK